MAEASTEMEVDESVVVGIKGQVPKDKNEVRRMVREAMKATKVELDEKGRRRLKCAYRRQILRNGTYRIYTGRKEPQTPKPGTGDGDAANPVTPITPGALLATPSKPPKSAQLKTPGSRKKPRWSQLISEEQKKSLLNHEEARKKRMQAVIDNIKRDVVAKGHERPEKRDKDIESDLEIARIRQARVPWKISSSLGGRFSKMKPVFSPDEKNLLVAREDSIQVYATKTSLLVRSLAIPVSTFPFVAANKPRIVGLHINPAKPTEIFVASSTGKIFLVDWQEDEIIQTWVYGKPITHLKPGPTSEADDVAGTVYVSSIFAPDSQNAGAVYKVVLRNSTTTTESVEEAELDSTFLFDAKSKIFDFEICAKGEAAVVMTYLRTYIVSGLNEAPENQYVEIFQVQSRGGFVKLAVRSAAGLKPSKKDKGAKGQKIASSGYDVALADGEGKISLYYDVLNRNRVSKNPISLRWHPKPAMSLAWSADGNYLISGGHEAVLVIWQLETSQKQFLPYLSGEIQELVVSPKGSSYGIQFSDNSIIVLSTAELQARTNITGIQANIVFDQTYISKVPLITHPTSLNQVLFTASSKGNRNAPFIQSFDTFSDRAITKQALARNNTTTRQLGPEMRDLIEPNIEHIAITADGKWLATIDVWKPLPQDFNARSAAEMYLKFWEWNDELRQWELVTRIDSPHPSEYNMLPSTILQLVALPKSRGFITLGADGTARIWKPRNRVRGGVTVKTAEGALTTWSARRVIKFAIPAQAQPLIPTYRRIRVPEPWGLVAISRDESVLAVAFPESGSAYNDAADATIYIINPATGTVNQVLSGLDLGRIRGLEIVGRYLAICGDDAILAWDLVMGKVAWALDLELLRLNPIRVLQTGASMIMAADTDNETIAVAVNYVKVKDEGDVRQQSRIIVWNVASPVPLHVEDSDVWFSNLTRNSAGRGFVFLTSDSKIKYLTPAVAPHITTPSSRSITPRETSKEADTVSGLSSVYSLAYKSETEKEDDEEESEDEDDDMMDASKTMPVERIQEIFEAEGGFEVGGLAERFDRLVGLLGRKPLPEEEEEELAQKAKESEESEESDDEE